MIRSFMGHHYSRDGNKGTFFSLRSLLYDKVLTTIQCINPNYNNNEIMKI